MDNKKIIENFYNLILNGGQLALLSDFIDASYIEHSRTPGQSAAGIEGVGEHIQFFFKPFSEINFHLDLIIEEEDLVVTRSTMTGIHSGVFLGIEPTNQKVKTTFIDIYRVKGGKLTEHWHEYDLPRLILEIKPEP